VSLTSELKAFAHEVGFHLVGVTSPDPFVEAELDISRWLAEGHQGEMAWLNAARARLATRPLELLEGARSLTVVGASYRTEEPSTGTGGRVARYAWGGDYHAVMKLRLRELAAWLSDRVARQIRWRSFVDDGPLVERDAAIRAGLGFRGKNTNLLTSIGSYVFLGALLTDVELEFDRPLQKDCGTCRRCIDACPTDALDSAYHLQAERRIAYLTTEHRGPNSADLRPHLGQWVSGCDICQAARSYNALTRGRPRVWRVLAPRQATRLDLREVRVVSEVERHRRAEAELRRDAGVEARGRVGRGGPGAGGELALSSGTSGACPVAEITG